VLDIIATLETFTPCHTVSHVVQPSDLIFIFKKGRLAVLENDSLPCGNDLALSGQSVCCFGNLDGKNCCFYDGEMDPTWPLTFEPIRNLQERLPEVLYALASLANHLQHWRSLHRFCGYCGTPTQEVAHERAKKCPACEEVVYPRISPCVIVLIRRGNEILLVRSPHFKPGVQSLVAGFMEPGETAEQTVVREVKEEVGLRVKNIRYVFSQPWPFPDSLMLGFTADYDSGELTIDGKEIEAGGWYTKDRLPLLPSSMSIARYIIDQFLKEEHR
jgi:NAD+ diphosphatase